MAKRRTNDSQFYVRMPGETEVLYITKHNIRNLTMLRGDPSGLMGEYTFRCYGDCTNITGSLAGLKGDVSKLSGDVTMVQGYCTGIEMDCTGLRGDIQTLYRQKVEEERFKKGGIFLNKHRFLTNEDNERLWDVWQKIANCTIGMKKSEYALIKNPVKNKPPFPVDIWGRHYVAGGDGSVICFSVNPVDILLLRTNQELQTCWSLFTKNNGTLRMRLLLARACINPTVGVCFRIKSIDKFNIFPGLPFKYYKHLDGTFFQYNDKGLEPFGDVRIDVSRWFKQLEYESITPYVVGHDGHNHLGHTGQNKLMFYEKYMKADFALWREHKYIPLEGTEHILSNFDGSVFLDKDFNVLWKSDKLSDAFVKKQVKHLQERIATGVFDEKV